MHVRKSRHRQRFLSNARGSEKWKMCMANPVLRSLGFKTGGRNTCTCGFACKDSQFLDLGPIVEIMLLASGTSRYLRNYSWLSWLTLGEGGWRGGKEKKIIFWPGLSNSPLWICGGQSVTPLKYLMYVSWFFKSFLKNYFKYYDICYMLAVNNPMG